MCTFVSSISEPEFYACGSVKFNDYLTYSEYLCFVFIIEDRRKAFCSRNNTNSVSLTCNRKENTIIYISLFVSQ